MSKKLMVCVSEPTSNRYYSTPFKIGEKVVYIGDVENDGKHADIYYTQFVKIKRLKPMENRVEFRKNFEFI